MPVTEERLRQIEALVPSQVAREAHPAYWAILALAGEVRRLQQAIRTHRDQKGDSRCFLDDDTLYAMLPDGTSAETVLPPREEFLASCLRFWRQRQCPGAVLPEHRTIAQLEAADGWQTRVIDRLAEQAATAETERDELRQRVASAALCALKP